MKQTTIRQYRNDDNNGDKIESRTDISTQTGRGNIHDYIPEYIVQKWELLLFQQTCKILSN